MSGNRGEDVGGCQHKAKETWVQISFYVDISVVPKVKWRLLAENIFKAAVINVALKKKLFHRAEC